MHSLLPAHKKDTRKTLEEASGRSLEDFTCSAKPYRYLQFEAIALHSWTPPDCRPMLLTACPQPSSSCHVSIFFIQTPRMSLARSRGDGQGGEGMVIKPADQKYDNVVVWLHGLGDTADVRTALARLPMIDQATVAQLLSCAIACMPRPHAHHLTTGGPHDWMWEMHWRRRECAARSRVQRWEL
jgi:hypothetical protein